jgi:hypothetical protein
MRGSPLYCLLGCSVAGCASSVLWAAGAHSPWLGSLVGLAAGCFGAFVFLGYAQRHHV